MVVDPSEMTASELLWEMVFWWVSPELVTTALLVALVLVALRLAE